MTNDTPQQTLGRLRYMAEYEPVQLYRLPDDEMLWACTMQRTGKTVYGKTPEEVIQIAYDEFCGRQAAHSL